MFFLLCLFTSLAPAQLTPALPPALARVDVVSAGVAKPGAELKLVVNVTPREGIHIYAPPQTLFKPISLTTDPAADLTVGKPQFPAAVTRTFEGEAIKVYDRRFSVTLPVVVAERAHGTITLTGTLSYQACDDLICYRPVTVPLEWAIQIQ
jgi:DsbC/DsbD-like thiol-disulfide interchange protein